MKTYSVLKALGTNLSNNTSTANDALLGQLISDQHRYLVQKYFDNERVYTTVTIGAETLSLTATPAVGATTATLSVAWVPITVSQLVVFPSGEQRSVLFTQGSATVSWLSPLIGKRFRTTASIVAAATSAILLDGVWASPTQSTVTAFSDGSTKTVTYTLNSATITWAGGLTQTVGAFVLTNVVNLTAATIGVQSYPIPANVSKIKNDTITIGQLVYTPAPVQSIQEWTMLNALPYTSDIPAYFYIYNNQVNFFPIPSSSGNVITFNYKGRVPDLSFTDFSTGTLTGIAVGSNSITGAGTTWNSAGLFPLNTDLTYFNLYLKITPPSGEGIWYPIQRFTSDTALVLASPIQNAASATASAYVIGQLPLLEEDFHDMICYGALATYFTSIVKDVDKFKMYQSMYDQRLQLLEQYAGTKSVNVDLGAQVIQQNPNLYLFYPPH